MNPRKKHNWPTPKLYRPMQPTRPMQVFDPRHPCTHVPTRPTSPRNPHNLAGSVLFHFILGSSHFYWICSRLWMKKFKLTKVFEYYILYQIPLLTDISALYVAKDGLNNIKKKKSILSYVYSKVFWANRNSFKVLLLNNI